jgi:predicted RNA-binding Zn-ribbon protein involved in translation (DUF1610 family)
MANTNVYLGCLECGAVLIEFPSRTFSADEEVLFSCPECGFSDMLLPDQTVADYAEEFGVKLRCGDGE